MAPDPKIAHVQILNGMQAGPAWNWNPWHLQRGICFPPWLRLLLLLEPRKDCQQDTSNQQHLPEQATAGTLSLYLHSERTSELCITPPKGC